MAKAVNLSRNVFTNINPYKAILSLAIPTIICQLIDVLYNLADTFFVGRLGNPLMIAAISITINLFAIAIPMGNLFGIGGGSLIARKLGRGENNDLKPISSFAFYSSILLAILYSFLIFIFKNPLLKFIGASAETFDYCSQYTLLVVVGSVPFIVGSTVLSHLLRNVGLSKQAGFGLSLGGILNIILDPIFLFLIFEKEDAVKAVGLATLISNFVCFLFMIFVFIRTRKKTNLSISFKHINHISKSNIKEILKVGVPSMVLTLLFIMTAIVTNKLMAKHGDLQLAAIGMVLKIEKIPSAIGLGLSQGMLPIVAYNYSSGNKERTNKTITATRIYGISIGILFLIMNLIFAKQICSLFIEGSNQDVTATIDYSATFLKLRALLPLVMFLNYCPAFCLQAIGDGKRALIHAVTRFIIIAIPMMLLFDFIFKEKGIAIAFPLADIVSFVIATFLLYFSLKGSKRTKSIN